MIFILYNLCNLLDQEVMISADDMPEKSGPRKMPLTLSGVSADDPK